MSPLYDPFTAFYFLVEFEGILSGGFSEVSGLQVEMEVESIREGGLNDKVYKLPKGTSYSDVVLKRGIIDTELWDWQQQIIQGKIRRQNGTISLLDANKEPALRWHVFEAYPVKWEGPQFNAMQNTVAIESLVLTHHGIKKLK